VRFGSGMILHRLQEHWLHRIRFSVATILQEGSGNCKNGMARRLGYANARGFPPRNSTLTIDDGTSTMATQQKTVETGRAALSSSPVSAYPLLGYPRRGEVPLTTLWRTSVWR
jgi:hypothetical protein